MARTVYIAQLKCPHNHCILATAGEYQDLGGAAELAYQLGKKFHALVTTGGRGLNPFCGLCGATELHIRLDPTKFATLAAAMPHLRKLEEEQAIVRELAAERLKG